jgi:hypothetical protein
MLQAIKIQGLSLDKFLEHQLANCGWILEKGHGRVNGFQWVFWIEVTLRVNMEMDVQEAVEHKEVPKCEYEVVCKKAL